MKDFRGLKVWEKAHRFVIDVYRESQNFPSDERFGLTSQVRRSAVSVASNIAEGCGRRTDKDFARFLNIAAGSACESEYQILLARDLGYFDQDIHDDLGSQIIEIKRMITGLTQRLGSTV